MDRELLNRLKKVTDEEQKILDGDASVEKELYTSGEEFTVDSAKMLESGTLITVRTHNAFCAFSAAPS